jgi:hypothetical protein
METIPMPQFSLRLNRKGNLKAKESFVKNQELGILAGLNNEALLLYHTITNINEEQRISFK